MILSLPRPSITLANAGGKAANLHALLTAGFPVPPGFVVTTAAYEQVVAANQLAAPIAELGFRHPPRRPGLVRDGVAGHPRPVRPDGVARRHRRGHPRRLCQTGSRICTRRAGRRALLGHGGRPARSQLRGPAGDLPQRARRRRPARSRDALFGPASGRRARSPTAPAKGSHPTAWRWPSWCNAWCPPTLRACSSPSTRVTGARDEMVLKRHLGPGRGAGLWPRQPG